MTCPRSEETSVYLDDMMSSFERRRFAHHLRACPTCRAQVDAMTAMRQQLRALPSPQLGIDLAAQFERSDRYRPAPRARPGRWFGWSAGGLAVTFSLVGGVWLGGALLAAGGSAMPAAGMVRVFDPVPPGGLCSAVELCGPGAMR